MHLSMYGSSWKCFAGNKLFLVQEMKPVMYSTSIHSRALRLLIAEAWPLSLQLSFQNIFSLQGYFFSPTLFGCSFVPIMWTSAFNLGSSLRLLSSDSLLTLTRMGSVTLLPINPHLLPKRVKLCLSQGWFGFYRFAEMLLVFVHYKPKKSLLCFWISMKCRLLKALCVITD